MWNTNVETVDVCLRRGTGADVRMYMRMHEYLDEGMGRRGVMACINLRIMACWVRLLTYNCCNGCDSPANIIMQFIVIHPYQCYSIPTFSNAIMFQTGLAIISGGPGTRARTHPQNHES